MDVLQKCLKSDCLLLWSAEDTFDPSEGFMRSFHILEALAGPNGLEVTFLLSSSWDAQDQLRSVKLSAKTQQELDAALLLSCLNNNTASRSHCHHPCTAFAAGIAERSDCSMS